MNKIVASLIATMNAQLPLMYAFMPGIQVKQEADWLGMLSSQSDVFYNAVYEARFSSDNADKRVDEVMSLFLSDSRLPMTWYLTPACQPKNLSELLESKGFKQVFRSPGMFLDLVKFEQKGRPDSVHNVVCVSNIEQLSQWIIPGKEGFGLSESMIKAYFELYKNKGFESHQLWRLFVGMVDGIPVSCARLFCTNDVAGIFHVATIPSARGKGYGSAVTTTALEEAKKIGCKLAVLASSPAGYNVYHRLGFRDCCFCNVYVGPIEESKNTTQQ